METFKEWIIDEGWLDNPVGEIGKTWGRVRQFSKDRAAKRKESGDVPETVMKTLAELANQGRERVAAKVQEILRSINPKDEESGRTAIDELIAWMFQSRGLRIAARLLKLILFDILHIPAILKFAAVDLPLMIGDVVVSGAQAVMDYKSWPKWVRVLVAIWNFAKTPIVLTMIGAMKFTIPIQQELLGVDYATLGVANVVACWGLFACFYLATMGGRINLLAPVAKAMRHLFPSRMMQGHDHGGIGPTWGDVGRTAATVAQDPLGSLRQGLQANAQWNKQRRLARQQPTSS